MTGAVEGRLAEAWVAVRSLHAPIADIYDDVPLVCKDCGDAAGKFRWPCPTARIVYGEREIAAALAGTPPQTEDGE